MNDGTDMRPEAPLPRRTGSPALWTTVAIGLAVVLLVGEYLILRLVSSPIVPAAALVVGLLIALAVTGYLGSRRGQAAAFVALALVLPYLIGGVGALGLYQRAASELNDLFGTSSSDATTDDTLAADPIKKTKGNPNGTPNYLHGSKGDFVDRNKDKVDDRHYAGQNCASKRDHAECKANGGLTDKGTSSGVVAGDAGYTDKNHDKVDDHFYKGVNCNKVEGGQAEFGECLANGGTIKQTNDANDDMAPDNAYEGLDCSDMRDEDAKVTQMTKATVASNFNLCLANGGTR